MLFVVIFHGINDVMRSPMSVYGSVKTCISHFVRSYRYRFFFPVYLNDWCKIQMRNKRKRAHSNNTTRQRTPNRFRETNHVNNIKLCSRNEYSSSFSFYLCSVGAVCNSFSHRMVFDCSVVCARWLEPLWTAYASVSLIYIRIRAAYGLVCNMQKLQC